MRIFVGISGGVDSAVAAAILKQEGHEVHGLFARIWQPEFVDCTMEEDRLSAKRVAAYLAIPFHEVDLSSDYRNIVVQTLIDGYARGETPNPDVLCNEAIKFNVLAQHAYTNGAEAFATGHYARVVVGEKVQLRRGVDDKKDQSYFLSRLSEDQLRRVRFPLGEFPKEYVRAQAQRLGLPNAKRPDSQGLCFVGDISIADFLSQYVPKNPGVVVDRSGEKIGTHDGAFLYTVGQRHGFSIHVAQAQQVPHYVTDVDTKNNILTVSPNSADAMVQTLHIHDLRLRVDKPQQPRAVQFQIRHGQKPQKGMWDSHKNTISCEAPQVAAVGQVVALYDGDVCIGAGIVKHP